MERTYTRRCSAFAAPSGHAWWGHCFHSHVWQDTSLPRSWCMPLMVLVYGHLVFFVLLLKVVRKNGHCFDDRHRRAISQLLHGSARVYLHNLSLIQLALGNRLGVSVFCQVISTKPAEQCEDNVSVILYMYRGRTSHHGPLLLSGLGFDSSHWGRRSLNGGGLVQATVGQVLKKRQTIDHVSHGRRYFLSAVTDAPGSG